MKNRIKTAKSCKELQKITKRWGIFNKKEEDFSRKLEEFSTSSLKTEVRFF